MLKKFFILILSIFFVANTVTPVYAVVNNYQMSFGSSTDKLLMNKFINLKLYAEDILIGDLGFTKEDISNYKKSGENAFDLAKSCGITEKQLKDSIIEVRYKEIDEMKTKGMITKKIAGIMKNMVKSKTEKWDGSFNTLIF